MIWKYGLDEMSSFAFWWAFSYVHVFIFLCYQQDSCIMACKESLNDLLICIAIALSSHRGLMVYLWLELNILRPLSG